MKPKTLIITTLICLDAALTATLPHNEPAAIGTAIALTMATALSCRAALRLA